MASIEGVDRRVQEGGHIDSPADDNTATSGTSNTVEMDNLSRPTAQGNQDPITSPLGNTIGTEPLKEKETTAIEASSASVNPHLHPSSASSTNAMTSPLQAETSIDGSAIGPATDRPVPTPSQSTAGPQLVLTLLLHTGARHLLMINEKYLRKRNVTVTDYNPIHLSVYTLKELIWRDWRDDWDPRPSSPSSIRLIHYGKMLDDKSHLKDGRFSLGDVPHVVHMTIKPQDVVDDEDARIAKGGGRDRENTERTPGCRCVIL